MKKISSDGRKLKLMELKRRWHICLKAQHLFMAVLVRKLERGGQCKKKKMNKKKIFPQNFSNFIYIETFSQNTRKKKK